MNSQDTRNVNASSASTTRIHAGQEQRIERQHALGRLIVPAIAERIQAGGGRPEIDHGKEERAEHVDPEMRTDPGQTQRQRHGDGRFGAEQVRGCKTEQDQRYNDARPIDDPHR